MRRDVVQGSVCVASLGGRQPLAVRARSGDAEPDRPVGGLRSRDGERRVVVRVRAVEPCEGTGRGLVEADAEEQPLAGIGEEVLDRLLGDASVPGGSDRCPQRDERALQVAARRLGRVTGADVAADRSLRADLEVGDVRRARAERRGQLDELLDGRRRADGDARPLARDAGEPGVADENSLRRMDPAVREIRDDDRPAADDDDVRAVTEGSDRLLLGPRDENFGRGVRRHSR